MVPYEQIDEGVRTLVRVLNERGIKTTMSCEGGSCHPYRHPTVIVDSGVERLRSEMIALGIDHFWISERLEYSDDGHTPVEFKRLVLEVPFATELKKLG